MNTLKKMAPYALLCAVAFYVKNLIYVGCNPNTLVLVYSNITPFQVPWTNWMSLNAFHLQAANWEWVKYWKSKRIAI